MDFNKRREGEINEGIRYASQQKDLVEIFNIIGHFDRFLYDSASEVDASDEYRFMLSNKQSIHKSRLLNFILLKTV